MFEYCVENHEIIVSAEILKEIERALVRKVRVPHSVVRDILGYVRREAEEVSGLPVPREICRDAGDLAVLGAAVAGNCRYIITGDIDLLSVREYRGVGIISPRAFWEKMNRGQGRR